MAGKTHQDREKASELRSKVMDNLLLVLSDQKKDLAKIKKWSKLKTELVTRMSTSILPRLNEVTGEGGGNLVVEVSSESAKRYGVTPKSKNSSS